jgi:hypothetical protein
MLPTFEFLITTCCVTHLYVQNAIRQVKRQTSDVKLMTNV